MQLLMKQKAYHPRGMTTGTSCRLHQRPNRQSHRKSAELASLRQAEACQADTNRLNRASDPEERLRALQCNASVSQ